MERDKDRHTTIPPNNHIDELPNADFTRTIGGTEYTVISHFNKSAPESLIQKLTRLLEVAASKECA